VLPIRNTVANARQLATLDVYSGGRVLYGVGAGWLREEAEAMNMPWDRRGRRTEEHIEVLRALWCAEGELVEFHGEFHDIPPMDPEPRPVQRPIPILVGGHSDVALERAARIGDGWIAAAMAPAPLAEHWGKVRAAAERHDRDPDALVFAGAMRPVRDMSQADAIAEYAAVGVDHLIVDLYVPSRDEVFDELRRFTAEVAAQFR
jgi:probable F420-dependent oxidoreductase